MTTKSKIANPEYLEKVHEYTSQFKKTKTLTAKAKKAQTRYGQELSRLEKLQKQMYSIVESVEELKRLADDAIEEVLAHQGQVDDLRSELNDVPKYVERD
jgi:uncharacterized coiled-coil DUF342 family protein